MVFGVGEIKMLNLGELKPIAGTQRTYFGMVFEEFDNFACQSCAEIEQLAFNQERGIYMCLSCFCEYGFLPDAD